MMSFAFKVDVSQVGLDEMREYPELVPACGELIVFTLRDKLTRRMGVGACFDEHPPLPDQAQFPVDPPRLEITDSTILYA